MSGRQVASGRLRVDRRRALEKMERHQLEDPFRYGVELVAAAIAAGAPKVDVTNDADELEVAWTGALPTRDELDGLFDHLFYSGDDPRERMLSHLATGVLAAHGLRPRVLRVERAALGDEPPLRLDVVDPTETKSVALEGPAPAGLRVYVQERPGSAVLVDMVELVFGRLPVEGRHVAGAARWSPVPVRINGQDVASPEVEGRRLASIRIEDGVRSGALWLVEGPGSVAILRDGVVVETARLADFDGRYGVVGWIEDPGVRLNASRSAVVDDDRRRALDVALASWRLALVRDGLDLEQIEWSLIVRLALAELPRGMAGPLAELRVLQDVQGREWSLRGVMAAPQVGTLRAPVAGAVSRPNAPLFAPPDAAWVVRHVPHAEDRTEAEEQAEVGRARRSAAERTLLPPYFDRHGERRFAEGTLRGAVRLVGPGTGGAGTLRVLVRIAGMALEELRLHGPGGEQEAILDDEGFAADDRFERVVHDAVWAAAVRRLQSEAEAQVLEVLAAGPTAQISGLQLLTGVLVSRAGTRGFREVVEELPLAVRRARWVRTADGARSLDELLARSTPWFASLEAVVPDALKADVLWLPERLLPTWRRWVDIASDEALAGASLRARRLAAPRQEAILRGPPYHVRTKVSVTAAGMRGELGVGGWSGPTELRLLRDGVEVFTMYPALGLPGVVGVLDVPEVRVDDAHAALADPGAVTRIVDALLPDVDRLALQAWREDGLSKAVAEWLRARGPGRWPAEALERPVAARSDGGRVTLGEAAKHAASSGRVRVLGRSVDDLPGFEDVWVADEAAAALLSSLWPATCVDAAQDVAAARAQQAALLARPVAVDHEALEVRDVELGPGVLVSLRLPAGPEAIGRLVVEARWRGRTLQTRTAAPPGLHGVLHGDGVRPDKRFQALRDPTLLQRAEREAQRRLDELALTALARLAPHAHAAAFAALAARLPKGQRDVAELRDALHRRPMLVRCDGSWVSLGEVAAAASGGAPVVVVADDVGGSEAEHPWTLVGLWALPAVEHVLGRTLGDGTAALLRWREGRRRLAAAPRASSVVTGPVVARRPLPPPWRGEVAALASGPSALRVVPIAHEVALGEVERPFAAPAAARVAGPGVVPDADGRHAKAGAGLDGAVEAVEQTLDELVVALAAQGDAASRPWLQRAAVGGLGRLLDAPIFPRLGGAPLTARELRRLDGVGVVQRPHGTWPIGEPPLLDPDGSVSEALRGAGMAVHALDEVQAALARPRTPPDAPAPAMVLELPRRGVVGVGPGGVAVWMAGVEVTRRWVTTPIRLEGWVEDPELRPTVDWRDVGGGAAVGALDEALEEVGWRIVQGWLGDLTRAPTPALRARLLQVLRHVAGTAAQADGLRGAVPRALAAAPLFEDGEGRAGTLAELREGGRVRAVGLETNGRAAPGALRFWRLDPTVRSWLAACWTVEDAEQDARIETSGWARREAPVSPIPASPPEAEPLSGDGWRGAVWPGAGAVVVRVGGRQVQVIDVPHVVGWVDGDFATDPGFTLAHLPSEVRKALGRCSKRWAPASSSPIREKGSGWKGAREAATAWGGAPARRVLDGWKEAPPDWWERAARRGAVGAKVAGWAAATEASGRDRALELIERLAEALASETP